MMAMMACRKCEREKGEEGIGENGVACQQRSSAWAHTRRLERETGGRRVAKWSPPTGCMQRSRRKQRVIDTTVTVTVFHKRWCHHNARGEGNGGANGGRAL